MEYRGIDIFCTIIDNFGDAGVVYRLAKELKKTDNDKEIRILFNRYNEIAEINPKLDILQKIQEIDGIVYILRAKEIIKDIIPNEVVIEAFGCDIEEEYLDKIDRKTIILNLEYLSAEKWVEDYHKMESFTGKDVIKKYFYIK